ncbi:polyphosphate kinase 1 [Thiohalobacter sp. IOR34]|uniref:polyphosphate kinase 1 n=1 Tax=Thiohalobacter sp. IOR34 TaxID=3057176 RepID=UPI0025B1136D|nr:polyphosphate kinase 1 [Thiohalobacter sp. IOR34]WJW76853.1 polyphosphate kinase 1 [Thiohalobacter sp. IOR34]
MDTTEQQDLSRPELYLNRELSLLQFNRRVLEQARDDRTPLLERLKFLCISSTNLDEFFEIRVAGLKQQVALGTVPSGSDNLTPQQILDQISQQAHQLVDEQYRVLNAELIPALEEESIRFLRRGQWSEAQAQWIRDFFERELLPVLSPLGLDPAHPFPRILNKSLNFIVSLEGKDAFGRSSGIAIVQAPRSLPRLIRLPAEETGAGPYDFVFLSSVIHAYVDDLFPGMTVTGCYQFRVTRNSDLFVDEEEIDDLMRAMEGELLSRRYGDAVRLEVADNCTPEMANFLLDQFNLGQDDLYQVNGPVNLNRLFAIADLVERPDLKYPPFKPARPPQLAPEVNIFEAIQAQEILLHHPFESFAPVIDFVRQAASDPQVLAIKQTLYRTGPDSAIVNALVEAARAGKEVTVVVELRARFDEEANIQLANRLQEAGAHVVYGVVGYKTHAKMILITRREGRRLRHYVHLGTGNYHARTARLYTDYGFLTCDKAIGEDVHRIFQQLTSLGKVKSLRKLLQSPFTLHKALLKKIAREAEHARAGRRARIIAKMNALIEPQVIRALYAASQAGVKIDLIIRGICCLRPGIAGVSDNIQVRSVVGRFLEHTRVFYFRNGGEEEIYLSSADWMDRNFFRRVETAFPVGNPKLRRRIVKEGLELYLQDNTQAWLLKADGSYRRLHPTRRQPPRSAQATLLELRAHPA